MKRLAIGFMLTAASAFAADVDVTWTSGSTPATLGDGAVALTYDGSGRVATMAVTPTEGGAVRLSGDVMLFGENPSVTFAAPGTLVFSNRAEVASGTLTLGSPAAGDDNLYFEAARTAVLTGSSGSPAVVFAGASLADYEPTIAYFQDHNPGGSKWWVARELEYEILRPYNVVRATEGGVATMTVQFQGVTRLHENPHTASITVKFLQQGDDIAAYTVRASKLQPLDTELGLDIDALADAGTGRAKAVSIKTSDVDNYNLSVIRMKRAASATHKVVFAGGGIPDADAVRAASDVAIEYSGESTVVCHDDYLPNAVWTTVATNHKLAELTKVEGFFHTGKNKGVYQTAYNLKARVEDSSHKACQFQIAESTAKSVIGLIVWFRQNGNDIQAYTDQYRSVYVTNRTYNVQYVYLGMDLEQYRNVESDLVWRQVYNTLATDDASNAHGVKQLRLTLSASKSLATGGAEIAIRPDAAVGTAIGGKKTGNGAVTVRRDQAAASSRYEPYLKDNVWTVVVRNRRLCDLTRVDGFFHYNVNTGFRQTAYLLRYSSEMERSGQMTCQFQQGTDKVSVTCLRVTLRQNGDNIEMSSNGYSSFYSQESSCTTEEEKEKIFVGMDFEAIDGTTVPQRRTYGEPYVIAESDDSIKQGVKELEFFFKEKSDTVTYTLADSAPASDRVTFAGTAAVTNRIATATGALFPSNGIVTVGPYADLNLTCNTGDPKGTKYVVETNGVLRINKGQSLASGGDAIDLVGGRLLLRDEADESLASSEVYVNYLTFANGADVSGKAVWVGNGGVTANWLVTGETPSTCTAGIIQLAAGSGGVRTFRFYVNDVTGDAATDFSLAGDYCDYGTFKKNAVDHWNCFLVKGGAGTMEFKGDVTLPNPIEVQAGTLKLAKSDQLKVSYHCESTGERTGFKLTGGTLALADGVSNAPGAFSVTNGASQVVLGAGATLNVPALDVAAGSTLAVTAAEGAILHSDSPLAPGVRRRLTLNGGKADLDENGNLINRTPGFSIIVF